MKRGAGGAVAATLIVWVCVLACLGTHATASTVKARASRRRCRGAGLMPTPTDLSEVTAATLCLIDRERQAHHVRAVRSNGYLRSMAMKQAKDMVVGDYFGDDSLNGLTPWQRIARSPYVRSARGWSAGQNIGWGTDRLATPAAMVSAWMRSTPHREIMLSGSYRDIGVGVAPAAPAKMAAGEHGATYAVVFAGRS